MNSLYDYSQFIIISFDSYELSDNEINLIKKSPEKRNIIILQKTGIKSYLKQLFLNFFPNISSLTTDDIFKISRELINLHLLSRDEFIQKDFTHSIINKLYQYLNQPVLIDDFNFVIIGCTCSLDIDVVVIVDEKYPVDTTKINENIIRDKLLIYDKELDINIVHIENKKVIACSKGSIKTLQGIIYYTQTLYPSNTCIDIDPPEEFKIEDRIKPTINYIITNLKHLLIPEQYIKCQKEKIDAHNGNENDKIIFIKNNKIFDLIQSNIDILFVRDSIFRDLIKGIFYKISTIILIKYDLSANQDYYTKRGVAKLLDKIPIFENSFENSLFYLFRGTCGTRDSDNDRIFRLITEEFISICSEYIEQLDLNWLDVDINTSTVIEHLDPILQDLFWASPVNPSEEFIKYFNKICTDHIIESHFPIPSSNLIELESFDEIIEKSYLVAQRSKEWFELRKKYIFTSKKNIYDDFVFDHLWINKLFHLIVGSIGEQYVMYRVDWSKIFTKYKFINVGILFDEKTQIGISPDGLLINNKTMDIIPIEIKCIRQSKKIFTKTNLREIKMARIQLNKVKQILYKSNIKQGLIVFLYIYDDNSDIKIKCECTLINLS
jgi:hypothetical protein